MAHGIRQGMEELVPNIWGKELEKEGAAWTATKCHFPMLSLFIVQGLMRGAFNIIGQI